MTTRRIPIAATLAGSLLAVTLIAPWALGQDPAAIAELRRQAEQGDAEAQSNLGSMYATGRGVPQDEAEAVRWYRLAAEQGLAVGQSNLGSMYAEGRGVPPGRGGSGPLVPTGRRARSRVSAVQPRAHVRRRPGRPPGRGGSGPLVPTGRRPG